MIEDLPQLNDISDWRIAAMQFVGAAARATDRTERIRYLLCASKCLDRAEGLTALQRSPWVPARRH